MSMKELALWRKDNGEHTDFTYGADPNEARTWDGDRVHGCMCDHGYTGYDCSLKTCPTGDDPFTYEDHVEVQLLTCHATTGSFTLSFREETTGPIFHNATADDVLDALMALPTMVAGGVIWQKSSRNTHPIHQKTENGEQHASRNDPIRVFFKLDYDTEDGVLNWVQPTKFHPQGDPVHDVHPFMVPREMASGLIELPSRNITTEFCNQDSNQVAIVIFDAIHGDVPALKSNTAGLGNLNGITVEEGTILVYTDGADIRGITSIKGDTEDIECNGRGICDRALGLCSCFNDWASSDGKGGAGYVGDCGFKHDHKHGGHANSVHEDQVQFFDQGNPNEARRGAN